MLLLAGCFLVAMFAVRLPVDEKPEPIATERLTEARNDETNQPFCVTLRHIAGLPAPHLT